MFSAKVESLHDVACALGPGYTIWRLQRVKTGVKREKGRIAAEERLKHTKLSTQYIFPEPDIFD